MASSEARRQRRGVYPEGINHPPQKLCIGEYVLYKIYIIYIEGQDAWSIYRCRVYMDVKIYSHREDIKRAYI